MNRPRERSDGKTLAALGAAGLDDRTATAGLHAHQKAMRALTAGLRRLISTFHETHLN